MRNQLQWSMTGRFGIAVVMMFALALAGGVGCASKETPPTDQPAPKRAQSKTAMRSHAKSNAPDPFDTGAGRPPSAATMYSLARIMAAQEKFDECLGLLNNLIQRYPNYAPAYNALAEAYLSLDRSDDAIKSLNEGIRRFPKDPILQNNLGMVHFVSADYDSALSHFERAAEIVPSEATYRANKAATLGMLGRTAEAAELYRRHLKSSDVMENVNVLMQARKNAAAQQQAQALQAQQAQAPTTAPSSDVKQ